MIGKTLGHYQITGKLGKGGMGEVYRAKDQKLGREVAIKVLPEEFAKDADRVTRFQREAKVLASLNHPNIAAIHGLEESGGTNFLVLELVEGETLADRIKAGPIPVEESLKLALQIAEALEAAHEKGVIHRDLKPANIKVTPDGKVKVLDFGLAKAYAGEHAELSLSNSPTLSDMATQQGVILGTAAYMSPEQARAKAVDRRADIWAFGTVMYEMLTGRVAFRGEDVSEILASVINGDVKLDLLPANLHFRVREALTRCLQRDLNKRYHDIREARYEIEQALADPSGVLVQPVTVVEPRKKLKTILPWAAAALILGLIIAGVAVWNLRKPETRQVISFDYHLPEDQQFSDLGWRVLAVSPDGKQLAYSTPNGLYLRSVNELTAKLIPGTEGDTHQPFFSPDGKWIGYYSFEDHTLKKISINGGLSVPLCDVPVLEGASWNNDETITYVDSNQGVMQVSTNGGTPVSLVANKPGSVDLEPQILPDGKSIMFTRNTPYQDSKIMVFSPKSKELKELFIGCFARYLPTGHMIYAKGNNLYAIPFDPEKLEATGKEIPVVKGILNTFVMNYAISSAGTLAYIPGPTTATEGLRALFWADKEGKEESIPAPPKAYRFPKISPDGARVTLTAMGSNTDIYVWDLIRKSISRLTFNETSDRKSIWTPDGKRIVFLSSGGGKYNLCWKASDGSGKVEKLGSTSNRCLFPLCWSKDGKNLVLEEFKGDEKTYDWDILLMSMQGNHEITPLLQEAYFECQARVSPDGRWMAYMSTERGWPEVFVCAFPDVTKGQWQVSTSGGDCPIWSPDGKELYYHWGDSVMAVSVETTPTFVSKTPRVLFRGTSVISSGMGEDTPWDISPDGMRFLMMKEAGSSQSASGSPRRINIVTNWFEELKQ
jgi:serine/threonine protein kinase